MLNPRQAHAFDLN